MCTRSSVRVIATLLEEVLQDLYSQAGDKQLIKIFIINVVNDLYSTFPITPLFYNKYLNQ